MTTVKCSSCGQRYQFQNISVLGHQEELWFISVFCEECKNQGFLAAVIKDTLVTGAGNWLPHEDETEEMEDGDPVTADDVLEVHEFLKKFDGDFQRFFARGRNDQ